MSISNLVNQCRHLPASEDDCEDVLSFLRAKGIHKGRSIFVLSDLLNIDARKAKLIVHRSRTWADQRDDDEQFHEPLYESIDQIIADEQSGVRAAIDKEDTELNN